MAGASAQPQRTTGQTVTLINYFRGNDCTRARTILKSERFNRFVEKFVHAAVTVRMYCCADKTPYRAARPYATVVPPCLPRVATRDENEHSVTRRIVTQRDFG